MLALIDDLVEGGEGTLVDLSEALVRETRRIRRFRCSELCDRRTHGVLDAGGVGVRSFQCRETVFEHWELVVALDVGGYRHEHSSVRVYWHAFFSYVWRLLPLADASSRAYVCPGGALGQSVDDCRSCFVLVHGKNRFPYFVGGRSSGCRVGVARERGSLVDQVFDGVVVLFDPASLWHSEGGFCDHLVRLEHVCRPALLQRSVEAFFKEALRVDVP